MMLCEAKSIGTQRGVQSMKNVTHSRLECFNHFVFRFSHMDHKLNTHAQSDELQHNKLDYHQIFARHMNLLLTRTDPLLNNSREHPKALIHS